MQYRKALRASFPPDRWPANEVIEQDGTVLFVLKDRTEIHRIGPPPEVYDYDTGKLIGRAVPRGRYPYRLQLLTRRDFETRKFWND